jgi:predicted GH43/DUF377 family glycosyl hydrolase
MSRLSVDIQKILFSVLCITSLLCYIGIGIYGADTPLDAIHAEYPSVLKEGNTYRMWYAGWGKFNGKEGWRIFYATSPDGVNWTKHGMVLDTGAPGSWDDGMVGFPFVFRDTDGTLKMLYAGRSTSLQIYQIGLATSTDGINWTRYSGNPILQPGSSGAWDEKQVLDPSLVIDLDAPPEERYKMWYNGYDRNDRIAIGLAISADGLNWTKYSGNPVITPGASGTWDDTPYLYTAFVLKEGSEYKMWYAAIKIWQVGRIGLATSTDGKAWVKDPQNPVLVPGPAGSWDAYEVYGAHVISNGSSSYQMWFNGIETPGGRFGQIGLATSNDGRAWLKFPYNPIMRTSFSPGTLRATTVSTGSVLLTWQASSEASGYYVYYGTAKGSYSNKLNVGNVTSYLLNGLNPNTTYYFAVTAYNQQGFESWYSNEAVIMPSADAVVFLDDMESGVTSWQRSGDWRLVAGNPCLPDFFSNHAWFYGNDNCQQLGSGELRSPPIHLPKEVSAVAISFNYFLHLTSGRARVSVSLDNGRTWQVLWEKSPGTSEVTDRWEASGDLLVIIPHTASTLIIKFSLINSSSQASAGGWLVDDVKVARSRVVTNIAVNIGVFRPSARTFYLDYNGNGAWDGPSIDKVCGPFGIGTDLPVAGDWDGDGQAEIGVFRPSARTFYLDYNGNCLWDEAPTDAAFFFGISEDLPVVGDWDGDGQAEIGVFRPSARTFYLDYNGNGAWDEVPIDQMLGPFSTSFDKPLTGLWSWGLPAAATGLRLSQKGNLMTLSEYRNRISLQSSKGVIIFAARGLGINAIKVEVFDLSGRRVYESNFEQDLQVHWNLQNKQGQLVANGVYLYVIAVRGFDGSVLKSSVRKLIVLR